MPQVVHSITKILQITHFTQQITKGQNPWKTYLHKVLFKGIIVHILVSCGILFCYFLFNQHKSSIFNLSVLCFVPSQTVVDPGGGTLQTEMFLILCSFWENPANLYVGTHPRGWCPLLRGILYLPLPKIPISLKLEVWVISPHTMETMEYCPLCHMHGCVSVYLVMVKLI